MATSTIRKAIGAVKDQTSISLAKVAGNVAPDLEVLVVKATTHDNESADEKYAREILSMMSSSRGYIDACIFAISKRLSRTRDWIVALKALMLIHKLLNDADPVFGQELLMASRKGTRVLNMSDFRDDAHSGSWDHSGFVRTFALYLDQKLEFMVYERKQTVGDDEKKKHDDGFEKYKETRGSEEFVNEWKPTLDDGMGRKSRSCGDLSDQQSDGNESTSVSELRQVRDLETLNQLLRLLDRFLASRPTGAAKNTRMVLVALHLLVKDSFKIHADISVVLKSLSDCFSGLEYAVCVKVFDAYVNAAKMIDDLNGFYNWCKDTGVMRSSEFPQVQRISDKVLGSLESLLRRKSDWPKSPIDAREERLSEINEESMNEIKALPPPENCNPSTIPQPLDKAHNPGAIEDLVDLKNEGASADQQGNTLALALFSAPNDGWVEFPADRGPKVSSAWENPAAENGKAGWELMLVESATNLQNQKPELGGGLDPLVLNGMYDQGAVKQYNNNSQFNNGSASSVAFTGISKNRTTPVLALPAPVGTVQPVGQQDPFAASLLIPPPPYVQIADMERKQQLVTQEQQLWQQYANAGMQGQLGMAKISGNAGYYDSSMTYGMPQHGYYYTSY